MTQPVTRNEWPADFVGPPPPPALPVEKITRDIEALPDPVDRSIVRLAPAPSVGLEPAHDASLMGARLDAFLLSATPTLLAAHVWVAVPIGFYMNGSTSPPKSGLEAALSKAGLNPADFSLVQVGRASPELVAKATQALIAAGHLPDHDKSGDTAVAARVRQLMVDFHIGFDCANYAARAALAARNISRAEAGFARPDLESLSALPTQGYVKVAPGAPLRTGDIVALHADEREQYEHRVIVRDAGPASRSEVEGIRNHWKLTGAVRTSDAWDRIVVDGSWGNSGSSAKGGVERRTWWRERTTGTWASASGEARDLSTSGPCGHSAFDVFRLARRR